MATVDWKKIKTEYITTDISYRKLAAKYDIPMKTIAHRGKTEKWVEMRQQHTDNIVTKTVEKAESQAIDYRSSLYALAYKVANQLNDMTDSLSVQELTAMGIKPRDITGAIKDLEDALHVKSEAEIREQEARIANLKKQAEDNQTDKTIKVEFSGSDIEKYAK